MKTKSLLQLIGLGAALLSTLSGAQAQTDVLSPTNAVWKYLDDGSDQGTAWRGGGFNDSTWPSGTAPLGYGMASITTTQANGRITYYHRRSFTVADPAAYSNLVVRLRRDDAAVVYINGGEAFRANMPAVAVTFVTLASSSISGGVQFTYFASNVPPSLLVAGANLIAVEIHQASTNNVDGAFDLELAGQRAVCTYTLNLPTGLSAIANQCDKGANLLSQVLPVVPDGTLLQKFNNATLSYQTATYDSLIGGWDVDLTLAPGQGAFINLPTATPLTFTGSPRTPVLPFNIPNNTCWMLSRQTVAAGDWTNVVGTAPQNCSIVQQWNPTTQAFVTYTFSGGAWSPSTPTLAIGESAFFCTPGPALTITCPANIATNICSSSTIVNYAAPAVTNGALRSCSPASGSVFNASATTVTCSATNACGTNTCTFSVTVTQLASPSITNQPVSQTVCSPNAATFTVGASGAAPLTYQWRLNGVNLPGATGSSYVTNVAGNYTVVVANSCGSVTSVVATLTVTTAPTITCPGNVTSNSCGTSAAVTYPAPTVTGGALRACVPASGSSFNSGVTVVTCTATNACFTNTCTFNVNVVQLAAPSITTQPVNQIVCFPNTATFSVGASGAAPLTYQWRLNGGNIAGATSSSYTTGTAGGYSVVVANSCGSVTSVVATLTVQACGPIITDISPLTAQMGDIITITGAGFDPNPRNNCVVEKNGTRTIPLRVVEASSNQLRVLVNAVPPGTVAGKICVATGTGAEAGFVDAQVGGSRVRIPALGEVNEPIPPGALRSLALRPEAPRFFLGTNGVDGQFELATGQRTLGWAPLLPVWTFCTTNMAGMSTQMVTLIPTPPPPSRTNWVFSTPATNGGVSFVISNDCAALTEVLIQGDLSVTGANKTGIDIIIPRLILNARLPAAACAQAICDLLVAAYAQAGITINCVVTALPGNAARITITVPGGSINGAGVLLCFTPAEANTSLPFITGVSPLAVTTGDLLTIEGGGFGNNPNDLCGRIMGTTSLVGLRVLTCQDDLIVAEVGEIGPGAQAGPVGLALGIGGPRSVTDQTNLIVSPETAWVFASTQPGVMSPQVVTVIPTPPPPPAKPVFYALPVNANGEICITVNPNCPAGTTISIEAHFDLMDTDTNNPPVCPLTHLDSWLNNSYWQNSVFPGGGGQGGCAQFVCQFFTDIFFNSYNAQFGPCFGYPVSCTVDVNTGKITITADPLCGCKIVAPSFVAVKYCIPPTPVLAPVITDVQPTMFTSGQIITIRGTNFPIDPNDVCLVGMNTNRLIPMRALTATPNLITAEVGPIPPDATPGRIGLAPGHGSVGGFRPAFEDLVAQPSWFFSTTNPGVLSPGIVTPVYVPPTSQVWYHSFLSNGQIYVFLPGPCPPGTKLIMDGHFDIRATNSPVRHCDTWLPAVDFLQGGSALDCAWRVCDSFVCGFFQRTGVLLDCRYFPAGNGGALVCIRYPGGTIVNGGMTVCVRICDTPPVATCVTNLVVSVSNGTTNDNFAGAEAAFPRSELTTYLASAGVTALRGFDDNGQVNRLFAHSFTNLPDCITKATLRIRLRANPDYEINDGIALLFAGAGGVPDPNRWSSYIGAGNAGPGLLSTVWSSPSVAEVVLDLGRLPLGGNQFKDLIPTLCAKKYLDLYVQDDTSVDYAILTVESCRCRPDIAVCAPPGTPCAVVTYPKPVFTDLCCPNKPNSLYISCVPPSGACFPIGMTAVHCTATDAAGRRARCCFKVMVTPADPPVLCPNPTMLTFSAGTTNDNFTGPEPASPGAGLVKRLKAAGVTVLKGFDECSVNSYFAHTFSNLPPCIVAATLEIRVRACGDLCYNDSFGLSFTGPAGNLIPPAWGRYLGHNNGSAFPGLFSPTVWTAGTTRTITLDLAALPNANGTTTDLIPALNANGFLDLGMQDDTGIDYAVLTVKSCCCRADIVVNTPTNACCTVVTYTTPAFTNNCPPITTVCTPPSGTCFPVGMTVVQCKATDALGQMARCFFKVTVRDAVSPVITVCPTNIIACTGTNLSLGVMPDLTSLLVATDNCTPAGQLVITQNPLPGAIVGGGNVTFTVTDAAGNVTTCTRPIVVQPCCIMPPSGLALWLPFDELVGQVAVNAVGGNSGILVNGPVHNGGYNVRSLCFNGVNNYVQVPAYGAINLGASDFSVDAWVKPNTLDNNIRIIVDHREESGGGSRGYSLFLGGGNTLGFQIGTGAFINYPSTLVVPADGQWHFVAVTVKRNDTNGIRFYVDNMQGVPGRDPTPYSGSLTPGPNYPFRVGSRSSSVSGVFNGCIDEVEVFRRSLAQSEVVALYNARSKGKCKHRCSIPWEIPLCVGQNSAVFNATICNPNPTPQTYVYYFQGMPVGPACEYPGPTSFSPGSGTITVPAGGCVSFPVTVLRPAGLGCYQHACFQMVILPQGTGERFVCQGSLYSHCILCATPVINRTNILDCRVVAIGPWTISNSTSNAVDLAGTRFRAFGPDMLPDLRVLSLNGLPPGVPWVVPPGTILPPINAGFAPAGGPGSLMLPLDVQFTDFDPGGTYTILLETDSDGDGEFEPLASMEVENAIPPTLEIALESNGTVTLSWSAFGWTLQEANNVTGPWSTSASQTSPLNMPASGARKFYRLSQP